MSSPYRPQPDPMLGGILKLWTDFTSSFDSEEVYQKACVAAVELTGADRSKFVRFTNDLTTGQVCKEFYPEKLSKYPFWRKALNKSIQMKGVPEEQPLLRGIAVQYDDVEKLPSGVFKDTLIDFGIKSILIVPVRWKDTVLGSFSIEGIQEKRNFSPRDAQLCRLIADAIAQALENSRIFATERYRGELLSRLDSSRTELTGAANELDLRVRVRDVAQRLCGWSASVLFRYSEQMRELQPINRSASLDVGHGPNLGSMALSLDDRAQWICRETVDQETRKPLLFTRSEHPEIFAADSFFHSFERAVLLRISRFGKLDSVLLLLDEAAERDFVDAELEYLIEFSTRATIAIEREEGWDAVERKLARLLFHLADANPRTDSELDATLYRFLTMVTAGFGLGFNRAAVFLLNEQRNALIPRFAIGQFDEEDWRARCDLDAGKESDKLEKWLAQDYTGRCPTALESWSRQEPPFPLNGDGSDPFTRTLRESVLMLNTEAERQGLPKRLEEKWKPDSPVALVRLHDGVEPVGLLIADNEFTRKPVRDDLPVLQMFCKVAAQRFATYGHQQRVHEINLLFKRLSDIKTEEKFSSLEEPEVLQRIVDEVKLALAGCGAGILTIDQHGVEREYFTRELSWLRAADIFEWQGIWAAVKQAGLIKVVEDERLHPVLREHEVRAVTYLPILQHGRCIGTVIALQSREADAKRFDPITLQRYADEASQVYNSWSTLHFLRDLEAAVQRIAQEDVSAAKSVSRMLVAVRRMLVAARDLFKARLLTFWPYDVRSNSFLEMERLGFDDVMPKPRPDGTTVRILRDGYHSIGNIHAADAEIEPRSFQFLRDKGQRSVQGIAIGPAEDRLGVLYLTYEEQRDFAYGAKQKLDAFARNVAVVLQSARAFDNGRQLLQAAEEVSRVLALGHEMKVLKSVAARTRSSAGCHSVTIFTLNKVGDPELPPNVVEGADRQIILDQDREDAIRLVPQLMARSHITVAKNGSEVEAIFGGAFASREQIQTTFAAPLRFHHTNVGLMFASFRNQLPDREIEPVKNLISLFASQAAVAIGNASRFRRLEELSSEFLKFDREDGVFSMAANFIMEELRPTHCVFVLREFRQLRVVAQAGWSAALFREIIEEDSHAGFTMNKAEPNRFEDLNEAVTNPYFAGFHPPRRMIDAGIVSGLAIPLLSKGGDPIGAVLVHSTERRNFTDEDALFLGLVANEAMFAQRSVTMLRRFSTQFRAAKIVAEFTGVTDAERVLKEILQLCLDSLIDVSGQPKASAGLVEVYAPYLKVSLGPDAMARNPEKMREDLRDGRRVIGRIELSNHGNRSFDSDDRELLRTVATLVTLLVKEIQEHSRVLENLATTTHEYQRVGNARRLTALMLAGDLGPLAPKQRTALTIIRDALLRLEDHHDKMTYTVKVLTGQLKPSFSACDPSYIQDLLRKSVQRFEDNEPIEETRLELQPAPSPHKQDSLDIDEALLAVVFNNLLGNALKFSAKGQCVTCGIRLDGNRLCIAVTDEGPGISKEAQQHVFDPWYQAAEHEKFQTKGFGVGLFISQKIVELHRGEIEIESPVAQGRGARFKVLLPVQGRASDVW